MVSGTRIAVLELRDSPTVATFIKLLKMKPLSSPFQTRTAGGHVVIDWLRRTRTGAKTALVWIALFGGAVLAGACSYSSDGAQEDFEAPSNRCSNTSDCDLGSCLEGICQAGRTVFPALLLEITPAAGSSIISGIPFTRVVEGEELDPRNYDLVLGAVSEVTGSLVGAPIAGDACVTDSSLPAVDTSAGKPLPFRLTLTPRDRRLGIAHQPYSAALSLEDTESDSVKLGVAPGRYDIYIEPQATELRAGEAGQELAVGCVRPPYLIVDQEIVSGPVNLHFEPSAPQTLGVTVRFPQSSGDLSEWTVDIIERDVGRVLSNRAQLGVPQVKDDTLEYQVELAFTPPLVGGVASEGASELVRLSPPSSVVAPIFFVERSVVDLFQDGQGLIDQLKSLPKPVSFSAPVAGADSDGSEAVPATVTIVATKLDSTSPGTVALFSRIVETEEDGSFRADLLPGVYRVHVEPQADEYATLDFELTVSGSAETQVGKVVQLPLRHALRGRVESFNGVRLAGLPLQGSALPPMAPGNIFDLALGRASYTPTVTGSSTDDAGSFSLFSDQGTFHLTVRPPPASDFAWGLVTSVKVEDRDVNLGRVTLSVPLVIRGKLSFEGSRVVEPLRGAVIRAHVLLKAGELVGSYAEADSVVAVGEARVGDNDAFRLLLPSSFK